MKNLNRSLHVLVAGVACALLTAPAALAATSTNATGENTPLKLDTTPAAEQAGGGGGGMVRTIVGLAVVIAVIFGLHWVLKQVKSSRESRSTGGGLEPLATLALGTNRSLHLVRAGSEIVLLGSAEQSVTPLRVYSEAEARSLGLISETGEVLDLTNPVDAGGPLNAGPGSPPNARDLLRRIQRWTVRG